jgi:hypothetical protein
MAGFEYMPEDERDHQSASARMDQQHHDESKRIIPKAIAAAAGSADPHTAAAAASLNDLIPVMLDFLEIQMPPVRTAVTKSEMMKTAEQASMMISGLYWANHMAPIKSPT